MAYTYDDFLNAANGSGVLQKISQSDLDLAKQYPEFGLSILSLTKDLDKATTAEQKLLATEAAEQLRRAYGSGATKNNAQINDIAQQVGSYGSFNYGKETQYQKLLNSVANPQKFDYDLDNDPVWSAYRKQYLREGNRATEDTLAKVSAATGGRPSSYAIGAAQQAGDYYASKLTDMIPTLHQNAYQRFLNDLEAKQAGLAVLAADREAAQEQHMNGYIALLDNLEQLVAQQEQANKQSALVGGVQNAVDWFKNLFSGGTKDDQASAAVPIAESAKEKVDRYLPNIDLSNGTGLSSSDFRDLIQNHSQRENYIKSVADQPFAGTSYMDAYWYLEANGSGYAALEGLLNETEWNQRRAEEVSAQGPHKQDVVTMYDSYEEYLNNYVAYAMYNLKHPTSGGSNRFGGGGGVNMNIAQ